MSGPDEGHLGLIIRDVTQADVLNLQLPGEAGVYVEQLQEDFPPLRLACRSAI